MITSLVALESCSGFPSLLVGSELESCIHRFELRLARFDLWFGRRLELDLCR